jgi:hypothetical protein
VDNSKIEESAYITDRVDDQISYYDSQSVSARNFYKSLTSIQIISGAIIPLISGFSEQIPFANWIVAILGLAVTISTAFLSLNKYQERWIKFRTTGETLKHFKYLHLTRSIPYNQDDAFGRFVNDIESVISKENSDWSAYIRKQEEQSS